MTGPLFWRLLLNDDGDMAEKAVVMFLIIVAAYAAFNALGGDIASVVNTVGGYISGGGGT